MVQFRHNPALHRLALLTAIATFPLIFMGGLVTSHQAGLSVPDWPNSYGYNMFLFPPNQWVGGILFEHTHRLMGTVVGFLAILFTLHAWGVGDRPGWRRALKLIAGLSLLLMAASIAAGIAHAGGPTLQRLLPHFGVGFGSMALVSIAGLFARRPDPRRWVRWLSIGVLVFVCVQGGLGGARVTEVSLTLAMIHGVSAQLFFCTATFAAIVTSRWWNAAPNLAWSENNTTGRRLMLTAACAFAVILLQLIIGAIMRHEGAGLAIPDLPLAYGHWLPPTNAVQLEAANQLRAFRWRLDPVTIAQVWLHFAHRIGAMLVTVAVLTLAYRVFRRHRGQPSLVWPASILVILLLTQLTLGVLTVLERKPADIASAHVAVGALTLVTCFVLLVRSMRLYSRIFRIGAEPGRVEVVARPVIA